MRFIFMMDGLCVCVCERVDRRDCPSEESVCITFKAECRTIKQNVNDAQCNFLVNKGY